MKFRDIPCGSRFQDYSVKPRKWLKICTHGRCISNGQFTVWKLYGPGKKHYNAISPIDGGLGTCPDEVDFKVTKLGKCCICSNKDYVAKEIV